MSDPKPSAWLELGLIHHLTLKQWRRDLGLLSGDDKLWEDYQERYDKQGFFFFTNVCYTDLNQCFLHL